MVDKILDDVKELILKEKGDPKILERIKRAAERDEVISVYERNYVRNLVETYLRPAPEPESSTIPQETKQKTPTPTVITKKQETFQIPSKILSKPKFGSKQQDQKTTKIMFGIGAIALAIILIVGLSQTEIPQTITPPISQPTTPTNSGPLTIETDLSSYELADIISISGKAETTGENQVEISIENSDNKVIWKEEVNIKSNGEFTTLAIAGGPGWEESGEYSLKVKQGSLFKEISFNFKA